MNRRELLVSVTSGLILASSSCAWAQPGTRPPESQPSDGGFQPPTPKSDSPQSDSRNSNSRGFRGCALYGNEAKAFFDQLGSRLRRSCGIPYLDSVVPFEAQIISQMFGVNPAFAFLQDSDGSNALASPVSYFPPYVGTVAFGIRLIREEGQKAAEFNRATTALVGIMAHEWAHILSFQNGLMARGKGMELLADCLAGWYLGWKVGNGMRTATPKAFADSVFDKGDFEFNNPDHHGTPKERFAHVRRGFNMYLWDNIHNSQAAFQSARSLVKL